MSPTSDVIIIGGGIMGCCTALELANKGLKVSLLEKNSIGAGPTGESSAIIRQHYSNELTARMAKFSLGVFQNFNEIVGGECGFTNVGFVMLVDARDKAGLEANLALQKSAGIRTSLLSSADAHELLPHIETSGMLAAAYEPDSGYADPYLTVTSIAQAARRKGVSIHQDCRVEEVLFENGRVQGVKTARETFHAPVVINSSGAWAAQIGRMAGLHLPIDSCRVQVAVFKRPAGHEHPHPVVADFNHALYFRPETGNLTLVGLIDPEEAQAIVDPDKYRKGLDDDFVLESGERLMLRYPAMAQSQSMGGYASLYAITPDWHPIVDELPAGSGFYVCSGFSGHGFKLGPAVGVMMAEMITGSPAPQFDCSLFSFARFAKGELVRGQYEYSIVG